MQMVLVKIDSPEWTYMWEWLSKHPINKDIENPFEAANDGEVWQYVGTYKQGNKAISEFRHKNHPITNKLYRLSLSHELNDDSIVKTITI